MQRKGISPIIASVLLLAVSLAVVGIFSGWAPQLATQVTDSTENTTMQTITCNEASIEIQSAAYDSDGGDGSNGIVNLSVRNTGTQDLQNLTFVAYDGNEQIMEDSAGNSLNRGGVESFSIEDIGSDKPNYVEGFSTECGSVTSRLDDINTDNS